MPPSPRYVTIVPEYLKMKTFHQNSSFPQSNNLPTLARIWTLSFQVIPRLDGCVTSSSWSDRITEFVEKKTTLKRWQTQPVFFPLSWFSHFSPSICSLGKKLGVSVRACACARVVFDCLIRETHKQWQIHQSVCPIDNPLEGEVTHTHTHTHHTACVCVRSWVTLHFSQIPNMILFSPKCIFLFRLFPCILLPSPLRTLTRSVTVRILLQRTTEGEMLVGLLVADDVPLSIYPPSSTLSDHIKWGFEGKAKGFIIKTPVI